MPRADRNDRKPGQHSLLKARIEQFSSVVLRLGLEPPQDERPTTEVEELWRKRWMLIREIVATPAPTIEDATLKAAMVSSLISNGELRIGLTSRCFNDYDRAITANGRTESGLDVPEPRLWRGCRWIRDATAKASLHQDELKDSWWREFRTRLLAIARYEAKTPAGLRLKGEIFREVLQFASETDGLVELQVSYLRDFNSLAYHRLESDSAQIERDSV